MAGSRRGGVEAAAAALALLLSVGGVGADLLGLDYCVDAKAGSGCVGAKVQLLRLTNAFGKLSYDPLGPVHNAPAVTASSALDTVRGIFYYVGAGGAGSGPSLLGLSAANGTQVYASKLPLTDGGLKWVIAFDAKNGFLYASGGMEAIPPASSALAWKTVWKHDPRSGAWTKFSKIKVSADQIFTPGAVVDPDSGTLFMFDETSVPDGCMNANNLVDLATGKAKGVYCSGTADIQTQVYDPQKKRLFGLCAGTAEYGAYVYRSCWWTASPPFWRHEPVNLVQLTDDMSMDGTVAAVDVANRIAFVSMHTPEQLVSLSLDSGEVLETLGFRWGIMLQFLPTAQEQEDVLITV